MNTAIAVMNLAVSESEADDRATLAALAVGHGWRLGEVLTTHDYTYMQSANPVAVAMDSLQLRCEFYRKVWGLPTVVDPSTERITLRAGSIGASNQAGTRSPATGTTHN